MSWPDFVVVYRACRVAAAGCEDETGSPPDGRLVESSDVQITAGQAAQILGRSVQAVRKGARAGKWGAVRHGAAWSLSERQVRRAARKGRNA
jgi:hypothetical protein